MNRTFPIVFRGLHCTAVLTALALILPGCEQPKPVEAIVKKPAESNPDRNTNAPDEPAQPRATRRTGFTERTPAPTPTPVATPGIQFDPAEKDTATDLLLLPKDFQAGTGKSDGENGWLLTRSDAMHIPERRIPFEIFRIEIEVKGKQTGKIWPEFHLALYHHGLKKNVRAIPLRSNFASLEDWHVQAFDFQPPLPAGQYRLDFRMMNPHTDEETSAVRELHFRHIAFKGAKSLGADLIPAP
jgi:hypothetical protein